MKKVKLLFLLPLLIFSLSTAYSQGTRKKSTKNKVSLPRAEPGENPYREKPDTARKVLKKAPLLTRVLFIFDASQSMIGQWQTGAKIDIAKKLLSEILDSLKKETNLELAFRVYGHQKRYPPKDCDDTRLEIPFGKDNTDKIKERLWLLTPKGTTPIARSLEACASDFPSTPSRNIVILITDGLEECDSDPCKVSAAIQKKGIFLKPFIIGIGNINVEEFKKQFDCLGNYYDGSNEKTFKNIMNIVISSALNNTTAQVNLLDINNKPTETNVAMTFHDMTKGAIKYNFVHTINAQGNPDTLKIDPSLLYRITVHTIPPVRKDSIRLIPGKHNIISLDAPQGDLLLTYDSRSDYKQLSAIVRQSGNMNTLNVQPFNTRERYIVGKYDLEVLCLPRIMIKDVEVKQSFTTTVKIDQPGIATFVSLAPGFGSLYVEDTNKLTWIYNLDKNTTKETVVLQPGNYKVIFRTRSTNESIYTIEKSFKVTSGVSTNVYLN
jgi:Ca-activated chloride channel homolog